MSSVDIFLGCMILFKFFWDSIDWYVVAIRFPELVLYSIKYLLTVITFESIVVLIFYMNDKFKIIFLRTFSQSLNREHSNLSLDSVLLNIVQTMISHQQSSFLLHSPSIILDNRAWEYDFFTIFSFKLGHNIGIIFTIFKVIKGSFRIWR